MIKIIAWLNTNSQVKFMQKIAALSKSNVDTNWKFTQSLHAIFLFIWIKNSIQKQEAILNTNVVQIFALNLL